MIIRMKEKDNKVGCVNGNKNAKTKLRYMLSTKTLFLHGKLKGIRKMIARGI